MVFATVWLIAPVRVVQFLKAFRLREPMKRDVAEKLHNIALRLHRPKSIWWSFLDNTVGEGPKTGLYCRSCCRRFRCP
jgi:hypothetical protein